VQNEEPSIDRRVLESLLENLDGDVATLTELATDYLSDAPNQIAELEQSIAQDDVRLLAKAAHTLKSTSMAFGAKAIAAACLEIHQLTRTGSTSSSATNVQFIKDEFARVQTLLKQELKSL
jgi:HPt (histidine-containing phosphotransfer) domain-containing protein